ncbi:hypothetical protein P692DRAFT_20751776 [Suillus brevipes Sb2]|nr:hypothetical protein P692DRAFT_20751776 [Suillus brevipes Sb2]
MRRHSTDSRAHARVLDLRANSFAHGQLYTAVSRLRCRRDIRAVFGAENEEKTTTNVVF